MQRNLIFGKAICKTSSLISYTFNSIYSNHGSTRDSSVQVRNFCIFFSEQLIQVCFRFKEEHASEETLAAWRDDSLKVLNGLGLGKNRVLGKSVTTYASGGK